jgi:drug/metabolite transporter (DMT)-like permease
VDEAGGPEASAGTVSGWRVVLRQRKLRIIVCFAIIYLVWGSSFLAGHIGVAQLPPLLFAALRALLAGVLLLSYALHRGERLPTTGRQLAFLGFFALTLVALPNGLATASLQKLPSNEVALLTASLALWIAGLGALGPQGQKISLHSGIGMLLGFGGVALLVWPEDVLNPSRVGWQVVVLLGCLSWAVGTVQYRNVLLGLGPIAFNAAIMLLGGVILLAGGLVRGELPQWHWEPTGMLALLYLAVMSSAVAYTAFAWLLKNVRTDRVATFAYVNPAIATLLGWLVLGESLSPLQIVGTLVILGSVALVTLPARFA